MLAAPPIGPGHNKPPRVRAKPHKRTCAECGAGFLGARGSEFCSTACKDANHNRDNKRGRVLMPLAKAWRAGRGKTAESKYAHAQLCALLDGWIAADRAAGRADPARAVRRKMHDGWIAADQLVRDERARRDANG